MSSQRRNAEQPADSERVIRAINGQVVPEPSSDPLACTVDVQAVLGRYEAIIGSLTGQLQQMQAKHEALEAQARKVLAERDATIAALKGEMVTAE